MEVLKGIRSRSVRLGFKIVEPLYNNIMNGQSGWCQFVLSTGSQKKNRGGKLEREDSRKGLETPRPNW